MVKMTEGLIFYWTAWLLWGIVTFFMEKNHTRTLCAASILICLICSNVYISFSPYQMMLSFAFFMIVLAYKYVQAIKTWIQMLATFTIIIGYTSVRIWLVSTPLSLFMRETFFISIVMTLLIYFIIYDFKSQLILGFFGIAFGELFYSLISFTYHIDYTIGTLAFFDSLSLIVLFLLCIDQVKRGYQWLISKFITYQYSVGPHHEKLFKDC